MIFSGRWPIRHAALFSKSSRMVPRTLPPCVRVSISASRPCRSILLCCGGGAGRRTAAGSFRQLRGRSGWADTDCDMAWQIPRLLAAARRSTEALAEGYGSMNRELPAAPKPVVELEYDLDEPPQKSGVRSAFRPSVKTGCRRRLWLNPRRSGSPRGRRSVTGCGMTFRHFWKAPSPSGLHPTRAAAPACGSFMSCPSPVPVG